MIGTASLLIIPPRAGGLDLRIPLTLAVTTGLAGLSVFRSAAERVRTQNRADLPAPDAAGSLFVLFVSVMMVTFGVSLTLLLRPRPLVALVPFWVQVIGDWLQV